MEKLMNNEVVEETTENAVNSAAEETVGFFEKFGKFAFFALAGLGLYKGGKFIYEKIKDRKKASGEETEIEVVEETTVEE